MSLDLPVHRHMTYSDLSQLYEFSQTFQNIHVSLAHQDLLIAETAQQQKQGFFGLPCELKE